MALKFLAEHVDTGSLSAKDIAEAYRIPPPLLAKILQRLTKAGLCCALMPESTVDMRFRGMRGRFPHLR